MGEQEHGAGVVVLQRFLISSTPGGDVGRKSTHGECERLQVEARVDATASVEAVLRIDFVEVLHDPGVDNAAIVVERMFEESTHEGVGVEHQVLADFAAGVGEAIGKLRSTSRAAAGGAFRRR